MLDNSHLFTEINAKTLAEYLVDHFCKNAAPSTVDYDYQISGGKMLDEGDDANTTYKFDAESGTFLKEVIDAISSDDRSEEDYNNETKWLQTIVDIINQNYIDQIRNALRSKVFKNVQPELVPMSPFILKDLEFNPITETDFLVVVQRMIPKDQLEKPQARLPGSVPVNQELFDIHIQTGLPLDEIVARKKAEGDPRYTSVHGAQKKKYIYNVEMLFYVDYSLTPQEEFIRLMKTKGA